MKILFVDDEKKILDGIRRLMRPMRREWDMDFAPGGSEALEELSKQKFDVLVTDMRMPGIDGPALLAEVQKLYPHMVRIVLSGHSSKNTTVQSIGLAHRYLAKPCSHDSLKHAITRAMELRSVYLDEKLAGLLTSIKSLPSLPSIYAEMLSELQREDASLTKIGELLSKDISMTAKVLQLVNSAFFGLQRNISDAGQAVALLGIDTVKSLALAVGIFSQFSSEESSNDDFESLWDHSFRTAAAAKHIAAKESADPRITDDAFTGGLLHDVGKLILFQGFGERYKAISDDAACRGIDLENAEREEFGGSHAQIGAYLLALWGLPDSIVSSVAYHHNPMAACDVEFGPVTAVHIANSFDRDRSILRDIGADSNLDRKYLASLGLEGRIGDWEELIDTQLAAGTPCIAWEGAS